MHHFFVLYILLLSCILFSYFIFFIPQSVFLPIISSFSYSSYFLPSFSFINILPFRFFFCLYICLHLLSSMQNLFFIFYFHSSIILFFHYFLSLYSFSSILSLIIHTFVFTFTYVFLHFNF